MSGYFCKIACGGWASGLGFRVDGYFMCVYLFCMCIYIYINKYIYIYIYIYISIHIRSIWVVL